MPAVFRSDRPGPCIGVFAGDRQRDADELRAVLQQQGASCGVDLTVTSDLERWSAEEHDPCATIMVLLGYTEPEGGRIAAAVESCLQRRIPVIVAYDPTRPYPEQAPASLHRFNGHPWTPGTSPAAIARTLHRMIGLDESHRRIFLSYRRGHGQRLAHQLRYALVDAGWKVFLDSFNIPPGADFQRQLFQDLDGRSLVVVVESPQTRESSWVDDEIAFATAHGIGIRALILPTVGTAIRFPSAARIMLSIDDLADATNDPEVHQGVVDRLVSSLQSANTAGFRLRTEDMVVNAAGFLEDQSMHVTRGPEDLVVGSTATTADVVLAVSRRPQLSDIRLVADGLRSVEALGQHARGWLVHRLTDPDPDYIDLIAWLARPHQVGVISLMALPKALRTPRARMS